MPCETIAQAAARGRNRAAGMRAGREAAERIAKAVVEEVDVIAREYGENAPSVRQLTRLSPQSWSTLNAPGQFLKRAHTAPNGRPDHERTNER